MQLGTRAKKTTKQTKTILFYFSPLYNIEPRRALPSLHLLQTLQGPYVGALGEALTPEHNFSQGTAHREQAPRISAHFHLHAASDIEADGSSGFGPNLHFLLLSLHVCSLPFYLSRAAAAAAPSFALIQARGADFLFLFPHQNHSHSPSPKPQMWDLTSPL